MDTLVLYRVCVGAKKWMNGHSGLKVTGVKGARRQWGGGERARGRVGSTQSKRADIKRIGSDFRPRWKRTMGAIRRGRKQSRVE